MQTLYTDADIARRHRGFQAANRRDHVRFLLGFSLAAVLLTGMFVTMAVYLLY